MSGGDGTTLGDGTPPATTAPLTHLERRRSDPGVRASPGGTSFRHVPIRGVGSCWPATSGRPERVCHLRPAGHQAARGAAQGKLVSSSALVSVSVGHMWPRDTTRVESPGVEGPKGSPVKAGHLGAVWVVREPGVGVRPAQQRAPSSWGPTGRGERDPPGRTRYSAQGVVPAGPQLQDGTA